MHVAPTTGYKLKKEVQICCFIISSVLSGPYVHVFFGLSKAGSVYSWVLDLALAYLPADYWLSYLDGILVYSMDF